MRRFAFAFAAAVAAFAQQPDMKIAILGTPQPPALAVPDFRGDAQSQPFMAVFNDTLWRDLEDSAFFQMVPRTHYPAAIPQQPADLRPQEWSAPPAQAVYLAMGYSAVQNGSFMLRGWLMDVRSNTAAGAQLFEKRYGESVDIAGARQAAHQFAADILAKFGATSLLGTHIYFVHESRPAPNRQTEIWVMDYDGANQRPVARDNAVFTQPAISPDGSRLAFVRVFPRPELMLYSVDPAHALAVRNRKELTAVASPSFTPDGKQIVFAQSVKGSSMQIFIADADGGNQRSLSGLNTIDAEPKVNPKTGAQIVFVSGRAGREQIYSMNTDGADVERISDGTGEAANPSWHPNGQLIAFAWTRGYAAGAWNIFVMNIATRQDVQLTHDAGKNENPVWAPDGRHLVFMSTRSGRPQIWSVVADGSQPPRQLTSEGSNGTPVWGR
jgi:TolB protein